MLNQGIKVILIALFIFLTTYSCNLDTKKNLFLNEIVKQFNYKEIYEMAHDSLKLFQLNKRDHYSFLSCGNWYLDSLFCFDKDNKRLISAILYTNSNTKEATHDGINFYLGEKINGFWFFLATASIHIPREMVNGHDIHKPLSYQQLHQIALKEVYGGYLKPNGEINEDWFTSHFEGPGWGDFENQESSLKFLNTTEKFTDRRKFFEAIHLQSVKNNWASRDTTQPIIQLHSNL